MDSSSDSESDGEETKEDQVNYEAINLFGKQVNLNIAVNAAKTLGIPM